MTTDEPIDSGTMRRVLAAYPTGVVAVAALVAGRPAGLAANSFTSVSLDPPMVSISVAHTSTTWPALSLRPRIGISVLAAGQQVVCRKLSARGEDRFSGIGWRATDAGAVHLDGSIAWLDCSVREHILAGDHDIVLMTVHGLGAEDADAPLIFHGSQFRQLELTRSA
jgi:flavin reductase (DIM6/NTAB) family NADH-FMN oxidoreductase RutF